LASCFNISHILLISFAPITEAWNHEVCLDFSVGTRQLVTPWLGNWWWKNMTSLVNCQLAKLWK